ncbi:1-(5-phosphoribosyl)-5-[(5-phosphoribosylamino) methylideneamino] imidazole-4-carboxamide isomerase [Alicyclobacillus hesperidum subsp. aegles]|uniref:1-(5-phosphoribosyl)-5-[(5- phosphoribosylamino)methylideneamino]imidazole-4- carboxamide isomerase n=1 Tax=Alicyclobacillus hesperidum TaxID=89784 RepID=UPI00222CF85D|nr:1-(5-phosphoribosyl)-5-[(5-phosphoribosylamino)methylideneamino]imidazole-4-carboxamide isomerase [Alicyclobacillus hesperidum]GLF99970.1 1-(5-phosphoribosyl)-5-[(5-phosphoribosylamino) methylideneamino] imidazole-4-carboxamide isomerase [Alicyclobacillus hesperidum subsp. aegles]
MVSQDFILFPAIDVLGGRCVRLYQGDYEQRTEYNQHPAAVAQQWCEAGARFLHVVDLDGAKDGASVNASTVEDIVRTARSYGASVQVGGGIRNRDAIARWLDLGVERVVLGTVSRDIEQMAQFASEFGGRRIVAGLDGRGGKLAVTGWLEQTNTPIVDLAHELAKVGVLHALVTDVDRDGTGKGANLQLARSVQEAGLWSIASGGISGRDDILAAKAAGLAGAVVGKALYDGKLDLRSIMQELALKGDGV